GNLVEFTERAVNHFKKLRQSRQIPAAMLGTNSGVVSSSMPAGGSGAVRLPSKIQTSGGRPSAVVGGEIHASGEIVDSRYEKLAVIGSGGNRHAHPTRHVPAHRDRPPRPHT